MVPEPGCAVRTLKSLKNHTFPKAQFRKLENKAQTSFGNKFSDTGGFTNWY